MKAVLCPVCNGSGVNSQHGETDISIRIVECHGCNGKGWVEVQDFGYPHPLSKPYDPDGPFKIHWY